MSGIGAVETTRAFAAGPFCFVVETNHPDDRDLVESLFRDLPTADQAAGSVETYGLERRDPAGQLFTVRGPRLEDQPTLPLDTALMRFMAAVNVSALDAEPDALHLHAAAAERDGRAVVIAAQRNTGKTTTVVHLVARGWRFLTDETVRLARGAEVVRGFPKPVSIKPGGHDLVAHLVPWMVPSVTEDPAAFKFVPLGATGATMVDEAVPHLVVLIRRPPFAPAPGEPLVRRLHPADAVVALMQETLDAERFGQAAQRLAVLAAGAHCYELVVTTPEETVSQIETLFGADPPTRAEVAVLAPSAAVPAEVASIRLGDRVVVHHTTGGQIVALDEAAARVWSKIGGWTVEDDIDLDGPVIAPFVAQLRALGFLGEA